MPKKLLIMLVVAGFGLSLWWWLSKDTPKEPSIASVSPTSASAAPTPLAPSAAHSNTAQSNTAQSILPQGYPAQSSTAELTAAEAYALELQYPPYAQPYHQPLHPTDERSYSPVAVEQQDGSVWALALKKYRFYLPEPVQFELTAPSAMRGQSISVQLVSPNDDRLLYQTNLIWDDAPLELSPVPSPDWPEELVLRVESTQGHSVRAPLEWVRPVAVVTAIEPGQVQGEDLAIALQLTTEQPGLYLIQALVAAPSGVIARLVRQVELPLGDVSTSLLLHGSVLPQNRQRLTLSAIQLQRMSPSPAQPPRFGHSEIVQAEIGEFAAADLSFSPYQPTTEELQRLSFLQGQ